VANETTAENWYVNGASWRLCFHFVADFDFVFVAAECVAAQAESAGSPATVGEAVWTWHSSYHICDIECLGLAYLQCLLFD